MQLNFELSELRQNKNFKALDTPNQKKATHLIKNQDFDKAVSLLEKAGIVYVKTEHCQCGVCDPEPVAFLL